MGENIVLALFIVLPVLLGWSLVRFYHHVRRQPDRVAWWQVMLGNVWLLAWLLSAVGLVGEAYFRFLYDTTDSFSYSKVTRRGDAAMVRAILGH